MRQTSLCIFGLGLFLATSHFSLCHGQYGIPDDDDAFPAPNGERQGKMISNPETTVFHLSSVTNPNRNTEKVKLFADNPLFSTQGVLEFKRPVVRISINGEDVGGGHDWQGTRHKRQLWTGRTWTWPDSRIKGMFGDHQEPDVDVDAMLTNFGLNTDRLRQ